MKEIKRFNSQKYQDTSKYKLIRDNLYETIINNTKQYVLSISFIQEPELGEGNNAANISQYPLEDILENFNCSVTDFYEELNVETSTTCYIELGFLSLQCIKEFEKLLGKHVYNKTVDNVVYLYADDEVVLPLIKKTPIKFYRKNGTTKEKISDICGIIIAVSMILFLIFVTIAAITKNTVFMILFAISCIMIAVPLVIIKIVNKEEKVEVKEKVEGEAKEEEKRTNPTKIMPIPSTPVLAEVQIEREPLTGDHEEGIQRKLRSEERLSNEGIAINKYLPIVPETRDVHLKDVDTICRRAIASLLSIQLSCDLREGRNDSIEFCNALLEKYNVKDYLNDKEKKLFNNTYTEQDIIDIDWEYESYWSLVWALGLIGDISDASKLCDCNQAVHLVLSCSNFEDFKSRCHMRPTEEILDMLDLYYRYHWAVVEKRIKPQTNSENLDSSIVQERRRGLEWLISEEQDWYDISLDT